MGAPNLRPYTTKPLREMSTLQDILYNWPTQPYPSTFHQRTESMSTQQRVEQGRTSRTLLHRVCTTMLQVRMMSLWGTSNTLLIQLSSCKFLGSMTRNSYRLKASKSLLHRSCKMFYLSTSLFLGDT